MPYFQLSVLQRVLLETRNRVLVALEDGPIENSTFDIHWKHNPILTLQRKKYSFHLQVQCHDNKHYLINSFKNNGWAKKDDAVNPFSSER